MDNPLYGLCVGIVNETFSNQKKKYPIDQFINRIGILQEVYVFNGVSFFKDSQTSLTLFFALFSKLIVYECIKYILHHAQKLKSYLCQKC